MHQVVAGVQQVIDREFLGRCQSVLGTYQGVSRWQQGYYQMVVIGCFSRCLMVVWVLLDGFWGFNEWLLCIRCSSWLLRCFFQMVAWVLLGGCMGVSRWLPSFFQMVAWVLLGGFQGFNELLLEYSRHLLRYLQLVARALVCGCQDPIKTLLCISRWLLNFFHVVASALLSHCSGVSRWQLGFFQVVARPLLRGCEDITRWLQGCCRLLLRFLCSWSSGVFLDRVQRQYQVVVKCFMVVDQVLVVGRPLLGGCKGLISSCKIVKGG